jgi:hypothetical protein
MLAKKSPDMVFTSLNHYLDYEWMHRAYGFCRKFFPKRKAGLFWTSLCRESIELFKNSLFSRLDMLSFS